MIGVNYSFKNKLSTQKVPKRCTLNTLKTLPNDESSVMILEDYGRITRRGIQRAESAEVQCWVKDQD